MVSGRFDELECPGYHLGSIGECTHSDFPLTILELDGPLMLAWCLHGDVVLSQWCGAGMREGGMVQRLRCGFYTQV